MLPTLFLDQKKIKPSNTYVHACAVAQSCPALRDPMDCGPPGSSVHGIFQARILEWVAISSSRESSLTQGWNPYAYVYGVKQKRLRIILFRV